MAPSITNAEVPANMAKNIASDTTDNIAPPAKPLMIPDVLPTVELAPTPVERDSVG